MRHRLFGAVVSLLVLAGCSGEESNPTPQAPPVRIESTGTITDGVSLRTQIVVAKGSDGPTRTSTSSTSGVYTLDMSQLNGPYIHANTLSPGADPDLVVLTTVATRVGVANLTPLTTLLTAQLLGIPPNDAFTTFNTGTSVAKDRITDASIRAAQEELTTFLHETLGVTVKSGTASFIESSFSPTVGDAMYDTILALDARLASDGMSLKAMADRIAAGVQACETEQLQVRVGGRQRRFCPLSKSTVPEEADPSILDYVFRSVGNEVLTVKVREDAMLSVDFTTAAGAHYSCRESACSVVTLGAVGADETRPLLFSNAMLIGEGGDLTLEGTLIGASPSITMPTLPCSDNRYFLILQNHSVLADCVSAVDPFGLGGNFGAPTSPGRELWTLSAANAVLEIVLDTVPADSKIVSVYFADASHQFVCQLEACNGVAIAPTRVDTTAGFPIEIRNVTFTNTLLAALGEPATLRGSFVLLRDPGNTIAYPPLTECDPATNTVSASVAGAEFNLCVFPPGSIRSGGGQCAAGVVRRRRRSNHRESSRRPARGCGGDVKHGGAVQMLDGLQRC